MKIIYEFDTDKEDFNEVEYETYRTARDTAICLGKILEQLRSWYKYSDTVPSFDTVYDTIFDIVQESGIDSIFITKLMLHQSPRYSGTIERLSNTKGH